MNNDVKWLAIMVAIFAAVTFGYLAYDRYDSSQCVRELAKTIRPASEIQRLCQ
jgi:hypothetical protein